MAANAKKIIENVKEWTGVTLLDEEDNEVLKLSGKTGWTENGYAHAKSYILDFVITMESVD